MTKDQFRAVWVPIVLFFLMLFDAQLTNALRGSLSVTTLFTSHLFILGIMLATFRMSPLYMYLMTICLGIISDSYFYGVIGIQLVVLPLIVWLTYLIFDYVDASPLTLFCAFVINLAGWELVSYGLQLAFKLTSSTFIDTIVLSVGPSLLLNSIFYFIVAYPIKKSGLLR